jgi:hypothetical protein
MFTSVTADSNFAGQRTAAGRNAEKKAKVTKALFDAHVRRPVKSAKRSLVHDTLYTVGLMFCALHIRQLFLLEVTPVSS